MGKKIELLNARNTSFNQEVAISNMSKKDYIEEIVECKTFDTWIKENKKVNVGSRKKSFNEHSICNASLTCLKRCIAKSDVPPKRKKSPSI